MGKKRYMTKNSLMLIHQLSGGDAGKYYELQDQMTNMGVLMRIIGTVYLNHTKLNANHLNYLLQKLSGKSNYFGSLINPRTVNSKHCFKLNHSSQPQKY